MSKNLQGAEELIAKIHDKRRQYGDATVIVGFSAKYAIYVHESIEMKLAGKPRPNGQGLYWDPQGDAQPRFLSRAVRTLRSQLQPTIKKGLKDGKTLLQALMIHGLRVLRLAQTMTPVKTGALRASGFVRGEEE
jgi:hypothetical protein